MPFVLPYIEGVPDVLARQTVLRAAIEFCEKTKYWRYELDNITPVKNIKIYDLELPDESVVSSIEEPIDHDGQLIELKTKHWLGNNIDNWKTLTADKANYIYVPMVGQIRLVPYPSVTSFNKLAISVILKPKPSSKTIPDFLFDEYFECLAEGAKSLLYKMPKKDWSDLNLYMDSRAIFEKGMADAEAKSMSGFKTEDRKNKVRAFYF